MFFIYKIKEGVLISQDTLRDLKPKYKNMELLNRFHRIQDAIQYAMKLKLPVFNTVKKKFTGLTPEAREKMRQAKLGEKNPNFEGKALDEEARKKISRAIAKQRRGEFHHMWNRRHRMSSRMKTSMTLKNKPKRMWVMDEHGKSHFVYAEGFVLPDGWVKGRGRMRGVIGFMKKSRS